MISTTNVTFAKQSNLLANKMLVKRQKVVYQCAMQTASDDAQESITLTLSSARSSASSSEHSRNVENVSALDILLTGNCDMNSCVLREFDRAAAAYHW